MDRRTFDSAARIMRHIERTQKALAIVGVVLDENTGPVVVSCDGRVLQIPSMSLPTNPPEVEHIREPRAKMLLTTVNKILDDL